MRSNRAHRTPGPPGFGGEKKHSFCFFPKNICSIINGLIINGVIINGLITNGLITNGLITNGLIILVDHMSQYHECFQQDWHI